jgi:hypothetical protein
MNISFSFTPIKRFIVTTLHRYHIILFAVIILGGLAVIVFYLNNVLILSGQSDGYTSQSNNSSFDQTTIERIKQLRTTSETDNQLDLSGRSNPFVE